MNFNMLTTVPMQLILILMKDKELIQKLELDILINRETLLISKDSIQDLEKIGQHTKLNY